MIGATKIIFIKLDDKIGKENDRNKKVEDILSEHKYQKSEGGKSNKSRPYTIPTWTTRGINNKNEDAASVKSYASSRMYRSTYIEKFKVSERPSTGTPLAEEKDTDLLSVNSKTKSAMSNLNEVDGWQANQKHQHHTLLRRKKQTTLREKEKKRFIKEKLNKQVKEKNKRKQREHQEDKEYENL